MALLLIALRDSKKRERSFSVTACFMGLFTGLDMSEELWLLYNLLLPISLFSQVDVSFKDTPSSTFLKGNHFHLNNNKGQLRVTPS